VAPLDLPRVRIDGLFEYIDDGCAWRRCARDDDPFSRVIAPVSMHDPVSPVVRPLESDLRDMFHRLNNQLGIILANAELLEAKATDETSKSRAAQLIASTLQAMETARELRDRTESAGV
jgi:hypothetical protein